MLLFTLPENVFSTWYRTTATSLTEGSSFISMNSGVPKLIPYFITNFKVLKCSIKYFVAKFCVCIISHRIEIFKSSCICNVVYKSDPCTGRVTSFCTPCGGFNIQILFKSTQEKQL